MMKVLGDQSELLENFGKERLDNDIILSAEKFLVKVVAPKKSSNCSTFNELRVKQHRKAKLDTKSRFVDLPCTSAALVENINRGYIQGKSMDRGSFLERNGANGSQRLWLHNRSKC